MTLTIQEIDSLNIQDADRCDGAFLIESRLVPFTLDDRIRYRLETARN